MSFLVSKPSKDVKKYEFLHIFRTTRQVVVLAPAWQGCACTTDGVNINDTFVSFLNFKSLGLDYLLATKSSSKIRPKVVLASSRAIAV